ncbi:MAG: hypothetical protein U0V74_12095 [Chitinophagales bacterium]
MKPTLGTYGIVLLFSICFKGSSALSLSPADSMKTKTFVIRCYIQLLNSKPSQKHVEQICGSFNLFSSFQQNKARFIDSLINSPEFYHSLCELYRNEYLQGATMQQIYQGITDYKVLLAIQTQSDFHDQFSANLDKLNKLIATEHDLLSGEIDIPHAQMRFLNNRLYDDLNMGTENMVYSAFNYLLFRAPTAYELQEGEKMVEGRPGVVLLKKGASKEDYLEVLFGSTAYKEGTIRYWYNKLLNREPNEQETYNLLTQHNFSIKSLIKELILNPEFSGL